MSPKGHERTKAEVGVASAFAPNNGLTPDIAARLFRARTSWQFR